MTGRTFDAADRQRFLNEDRFGLAWEIERARANDGTSRMVWNWTHIGYGAVALGLIVGADQALLAAARQTMVDLANYSLAVRQWEGWVEIVPEADFVRRGRRHTIDHPDRPEAFVVPNLILLHDHWLETGLIDRVRMTTMFAQSMAVPAVQGVMGEHELMPLSAWLEIQALQGLPDPGGNRRPDDAGRRIGQLLASDPAQLHDARSPVRRKARAYMRKAMGPRWLAGGLALEAMIWLQTFEWREGESGLSPREVMLRAYAYMPDVEPPANIAAEVSQLRRRDEQ